MKSTCLTFTAGRLPDYVDFTFSASKTTAHLKLLLVDDDPLLAKSLAFVLERFGLAVKPFTDPAQSLAYPGLHQIDVLITDLEMPEMDGVELIHALRARGWCKPVVLMSGYPARLRQTVAPVRCKLTKPFTRLQLLKALAACLSENPNRSQGEVD